MALNHVIWVRAVITEDPGFSLKADWLMLIFHVSDFISCFPIIYSNLKFYITLYLSLVL